MFKKPLIAAAAASIVVVAGLAQAQAARDYIFIVGSSTVYPFTTTVAEQFGRGGKFKTPKVESTGTGGGHQAVLRRRRAAASRRRQRFAPDQGLPKSSTCAKNGVKDILEVKIGYDGIVLANAKSAPPFNLTRKDLFLALAKKVPDPVESVPRLIDNPYQTWKDVNSVAAGARRSKYLVRRPPRARAMRSLSW